MKTKDKILVCIAAVVVIIIASVFLIVECMPTANWHQTVTVKDGQATPNSDSFTFKVMISNPASLHYEWWEDEEPGFITGLVLLNPDGSERHAVTANMMKADMHKEEYEAGVYTVQLVYLTSEEMLRDFLLQHNLGYDGPSDFEFTDGTFTINYLVSAFADTKVYYMFGLLVVLCMTVVFVVLILSFISKDKSIKAKYDERQIAARGIAFKYGFFTNVILVSALYFAESMGLKFYINSAIVSIIISCGVVLTISILKDAYVAINENKGRVITILALLSLINIGIGVASVKNNSESALMAAYNFMAGALLIYTLVIMLIKSVIDKRGAAE